MSAADEIEHDESPQTYDGSLELETEGSVHIIAGVHLSGFFQPIDGTFRWHGRTDPDPRVTELAGKVGRKEVNVRVPRGDWTTARLAEANPWGGYRIAGRGRPPFAVEPIEVEVAATD